MFGIFRRSNEPIDQTAPPYGGPLTLIVVSIALANLSLWCFGVRQQEIFDAVEEGAAVVEKNMIGEIEEDEVRDAIRLQRQSFKFWSTLMLLGDLVVAPLSPILRAIAVTVAFSAAAALFGRPTSYGIALAENMALQSFWAVSAVLEATMRLAVSPDAVNSWIVLMPAKEYPASTLAQLAILNPLAVCGWIAMGWYSWRRRQANWFLCGLIILFLALFETSIAGSIQSTMGSFMRLSFGS